jgi:cell division protein FtsI (penicillin-binding protein 3)
MLAGLPLVALVTDSFETKALRRAKQRLLFVAFGCVALFLIVCVSLINISFSSSTKNRQNLLGTPKAYQPERADVLDRNGMLLATNLVTHSLFANPQDLIEPTVAAEKLAKTFPDLSLADLKAKLLSDKEFVWIKRGLTPQQYLAVNRLGLPGLDFKREEKRVYPKGKFAAHILGYTDVDDKGIAGIESTFNKTLSNKKEEVTLSIDERVQHILTHALTKAMTDFNAVAAGGLVLDIKTGELLAMASLPDFDPNTPQNATKDGLFNRMTLGVYEMGSTVKILTFAMGLENGTATLASSYDATQAIKVGRFKIDDYKAKRRWLSFPEVFLYSSNIGSVKIALDVGVAKHRDFLQKLGLLSPAPLELPEMGAPLIPNPWNEVNTMTIAFGHGFSINAIQLCASIGAILNGGQFIPATLLKDGNRDKTPVPVLSPETSEIMRRLMRMNVIAGTGTKAEVKGYYVGGKTGTSEKNSGRGYNKKSLLSSFIAAYPMYDPRYLVFVMVDEPKGNAKSFGYATGGWVAAPAVREIIAKMSPLLGIMPAAIDDPTLNESLAITTGFEGGTIADH